jgi:hypothetical protein
MEIDACNEKRRGKAIASWPSFLVAVWQLPEFSLSFGPVLMSSDR